MGAQKGKDLLIRAGDGARGFVAVAGLRTRQITLNAETVDVTNADSAGRWRVWHYQRADGTPLAAGARPAA